MFWEGKNGHVMYKIFGKFSKCFACAMYGHTYVKCVTNSTKAKKPKAYKIDKQKDFIGRGPWGGMTCDSDKYFNFQHFTNNIGIS